jgi:hypothetical protein
MKISTKLFFSFSSITFFLLITGFYFSKKQNHFVKIEATKMNVLYIGVDNLISVSGPGLNKENISITTRYGTTRPNTAGGYIVNVSVPGTTSVAVSEKDGDKTTFLDSMQFRVKRIPDPVISVGGIKAEGQLTHEEIMNISEVYANLVDFDFDCKYEVVSFTLSVEQNGKPLDFSGIGGKLSDVMKSTLFFQPPGAQLFFHEVTVKGPDGVLRKVPGVMITVK